MLLIAFIIFKCAILCAARRYAVFREIEKIILKKNIYKKIGKKSKSNSPLHR